MSWVSMQLLKKNTYRENDFYIGWKEKVKIWCVWSEWVGMYMSSCIQYTTHTYAHTTHPLYVYSASKHEKLYSTEVKRKKLDLASYFSNDTW